MTSLGQAHHDGSERYVDEPYPDLGDTVTVRMRVPAAAAADRVVLRFVRDGEAEFVDARVDEQDQTETWWRADLPIHNEVTPYRFLLSAGADGYHWLTGDGVLDHDPTDAGDFRLTTFPAPPSWATDATFYQVFPDRFASSGVERPLPDWVLPARWDDPVIQGGQEAMAQLYGGDLPGIRERLDHIAGLGMDALYLNPFFPAESNHRYNASSFDHVDPLLGGDAALAALTAEAHRRGMKVVGDLTPNHTGDTHHWFQTACADASSPEASFYSFDRHPHEYRAWLGVSTLPELDHRSPELRRRLYEGPDSVVAKWLQAPFELDGWRIDVAHMVARQGEVDLNRDVARAIRRTMHEINPEAYLVAEHPFDASPELLGDGWHGTMAYAGFTRPLWCWLGEAGTELDFLGMPVPLPSLPGPAVARTLTTFRAAAPWRSTTHNLNLLDSHDTARFRSLVGGRERQLVGAGLLFTFPGLPSVLAGDEVGLTGLDHEAGRQPFPWERARWDLATYDAFRRLAELRRSHRALRRGGFRWAAAGEDALAYLRESADERLLLLAARSSHPALTLAAEALGLSDGDEIEPLLDSPSLAVTGGVVRLPGDGPAFFAWRLPA